MPGTRGRPGRTGRAPTTPVAAGAGIDPPRQRRPGHGQAVSPIQAVSGSLFDQAPDGVLLLSVSPREDLVGRDVRSLIHPDDLQATPLRADQVSDGGTAVNERRYSRADGSWVW